MQIITVGDGKDEASVINAIANVPDPIDDLYRILCYEGGSSNFYTGAIDTSKTGSDLLNNISIESMFSHGGIHTAAGGGGLTI